VRSTTARHRTTSLTLTKEHERRGKRMKQRPSGLAAVVVVVANAFDRLTSLAIRRAHDGRKNDARLERTTVKKLQRKQFERITRRRRPNKEGGGVRLW